MRYLRIGVEIELCSDVMLNVFYCSYHRHLKAERRKTAFKALEKLKSEDPESWKEKAEEVERARIEVSYTYFSYIC